MSTQPAIYDPSRPEDLTEALRVAYGLLGITLNLVGQRVEVSPEQYEAIEQGRGPVFGIMATERGGLILTPDNFQELPSDISE